MKISDNTFVALSYKLNVGEGDELELMEEATPENPMSFIFGMGTMLSAFEDNLAGLEKGSKFSFSLSPEEAYGESNESYIIELPKQIFEVDGKFDDERVFEGNTIPMRDANGNIMNGSVMEIKDDVIVMDFNHPLAGETLQFSGEILDVHDATPEEIAAMATGGCGDCSCDDCGDEHNHEGGCGGCHH